MVGTSRYQFHARQMLCCEHASHVTLLHFPPTYPDMLSAREPIACGAHLLHGGTSEGLAKHRHVLAGRLPAVEAAQSVDASIRCDELLSALMLPHATAALGPPAWLKGLSRAGS